MSDIGPGRDYSSGEDFVLEYGDLRLTFSETDFRERAEHAARKLRFIKAPLDEDELSDLVRFVVDAEIDEPVSPLADHVDSHLEVVWGAGQKNAPELVEWLRRLVFRGAWLDQGVMQGDLEAEFDYITGDFKYKQPHTEPAEVYLYPEPSWEAIAYQGRPHE